MRIGVIHATMKAVQPLENAMLQENPELKLVNFVNEELLYHANRFNGVDDWGKKTFLNLFTQAVDADVSAIVIACSLYSTFADDAQKFTEKPVIAIDGPMIKDAVFTGKKIGILATTASAGPTEERKILDAAQAAGKTISTQVKICTEAMDALKSQNEPLHNHILSEAAAQLEADGCDCIVLSQITMACAKKEMTNITVPVLTSPESGARYLNHILD